MKTRRFQAVLCAKNIKVNVQRNISKASTHVAEYEILPCRKRSHKFHWTMKEVHMRMDQDIHEGRVMAYEDYLMWWRRYLGFEAALNIMEGKCKVLRSQALIEDMSDDEEEIQPRTYGRSLLDEYRAYYARFPARRPDELYDPLRDAQEQRWRKADWRAMQKRAKQDARKKSQA